VADINYNVSVERKKNGFKNNWKYKDWERDELSKEFIFDLDNDNYQLGIKAYVPIKYTHSYEAQRINKIFNYSLKDTAVARKANIDAAIAATLAAETKHYKEVKKDIDELLGKISEAKIYAVKIEEVLSSSKFGFLKVYPDIVNIFKSDGIYYYDKGKCNLSEAQNQESGAQNQDSWEAYNQFSIKCTHDFNNIEQAKKIEIWDGYVLFLNSLSVKTGIKLFNNFECTVDIAYANKQFDLLKIIIHYPQMMEPLYFIQIIVSCISPISEKEEVKLTLYLTKENVIEFKENKWGQLFQSMQKLDCFNSMLVKKPGLFVPLNNMPPAAIMSALMLLIGTELKKGNLTSQNISVYIQEIKIVIDDNFIEVQIICYNVFDDETIRKISSIDEESKKRGLRSCLKTICESMGQQNPLILDTDDVNEMRNVKVKTANPLGSKIIIGVHQNKTIILLQWYKNIEKKLTI
jgi:hypothetical protein